jgi:hypothetical protein
MHIALLLPLVTLTACGGAQTDPEASPVAEPAEPVTVVLALRFVEGAEDEETETPTTRVLLVDIDERRGRRTTDMGTFDGVCSHARAREGHLMAAQCFWAATGARLEVRREDDLVIVTEDVLDEDGNLVDRHEKVRIDLPPDAELEVMAPTTRLGGPSH